MMRTEWVREAIAKRLKEAAVEAGMTCQQIAKKLGVTPATVYRWWEADRIPSEAMMERYAEVTGKEISWIQAGVYHGERTKDFAAWALAFARMVKEGVPADVAAGQVMGAPDELSLREKKYLRSSTEALRRVLINFPEDEASQAVLLEMSRLILREASE